MLYRQRFPASAPQAIQWLATSHALAQAGAQVWLTADPPLQGSGGDAEQLLAEHGLLPSSRLNLSWLCLPGRTLRGLEYRIRFLAQLVASRQQRPVIFSRSLRYSVEWLRLRRHLPGAGLLVHEWHYSSAANAQEAGRTDEARWLAGLEAEVARGASGHVTVAPGMVSYLHDHYEVRGPAVVIPNGGPPPRERRAEDPAQRRVVYAGLFRRTSDLSLVLELAGRLPPDVELLVLGGDEGESRLNSVREAAARLGVLARIQFRGSMAPAQARDLMASATVGLATFADSLNLQKFACPLKILEYQAQGIPLVATDHPTVRALVKHEETGLLIPPGDAELASRAVHRLLDDPGLRQKLGQASLQAATVRTWQRRGERLLQLFTQLGAGDHPQAPSQDGGRKDPS